ncbi:polysaccharide biosynthesis tyrosine autokinase [Methylocystis sp. H62]|uniref:GumC family protein n=1 Tax=Methylocystis sp. H62 TaxID=2785789 RepID=UPI0018C2D369|nr:polysaccharide biosynthesis tyrosine autokinase [Methylocystis sp. H62]MBG0792616.1 polysaccharide biosynthesis tyrosine autokinase [Methylocystis sp. H62]
MIDEDRNDASDGGAPAGRSLVQSPAYLPPRYAYGEIGDNLTGDGESGIDVRAILRVLIKRKWLIGGVAATFAVLGLLKGLLERPLYSATIRLQIDRTAPTIIKGSENASIEADSDFETEVELLKSSSLTQRVASLTRLDPSALGGFSVKAVPFTKLVDLTVTNADPASAQKVANAYGSAYTAAHLEKRFQANAYAKSFLEDQLKQLKLRLEQSENQLVAFAEKQQIIQTGEKTSIAEGNLAAANTALGVLTAERMKNEQLWRQAERSTGIDIPQILTNKAIEDLRSRRGQLITEYQEKSETFRADYPGMSQLNNKIKETDRQINQEVKAIKASLKAAFESSLSQENEMKERVEKLRDATLDFQKRSIRYNILKREVDTTRSLYESLLQRYKEVDVASGIGTNNVFIIDKAQLPGAPTSPNIPKTFALAFAAGLVLGVAAAFAREYFDDVIYSPLDAETASALTLIGIIPRVRQNQTFEIEAHDPRSAISEAFRSTCTSLQFSTEFGIPKTLMVTSASPGEGKSSTALGIGRQLDAMGLKVLIVDADLRNPSLHTKAGIGNTIGLSNYLSHHCEADDVIQQIDSTTHNLHVMPSGPLPPAPMELLHGARFRSLLSVYSEIFDVIIVDGPPVMGMADAIVLSNAVSATLLVIASGEGRIGLVRNALKRLAQARVTPLGLVLTKYDARKAGGHGYGYGYGTDLIGTDGVDKGAEARDELDHAANDSAI